MGEDPVHPPETCPERRKQAGGILRPVSLLAAHQPRLWVNLQLLSPSSQMGYYLIIPPAPPSRDRRSNDGLGRYGLNASTLKHHPRQGLKVSPFIQKNISMKQTHGHREQTSVTKGNGGRDGLGRFGISRCRLLYIRWINNKVLL